MSCSEVQGEAADARLDSLRAAFVEKVLLAQKARAEIAAYKDKQKRIAEREEALSKNVESYVSNISPDATRKDIEGAFDELFHKPMQKLMAQREHVDKKKAACEGLIVEYASGASALAKSAPVTVQQSTKRARTKLLEQAPPPAAAPKRARKTKPVSRLAALRKQAVRKLPSAAEKATAKIREAADTLAQLNMPANQLPRPRVSEERRAEIARRNLAAREKREAEAKAKQAREFEEAALRNVERARVRSELERQKPHLDVRAENDLLRRIENVNDVAALFSEDEADSGTKLGEMRDALSRMRALE